uniref:Endothelin-1 n=1 Tax=Kryptolebias marmoratus TaxID=37003 RepID=A0A3Q3A8H4_KRYMA
MEVKLWVSVMSVTCSWIFCTGLSAPAAETSTAAPLRHVRNKRCSCATFLDRECVYFCHLDIIWVNTPERVVSYGLGNAPRARRALTDSMATSRGGLRCRENPDLLRVWLGSGAVLTDAVISPAGWRPRRTRRGQAGQAGQTGESDTTSQGAGPESVRETLLSA